MLSIDLNCDMGEGFDSDAAIMPFISSVNIACGYHAGDTDTMHRTVELALKNNVLIGAHPSYPDRENFGRTDMTGKQLQPADLPAIITDQINLLEAICKTFGTSLHHVKPHGALYNRAAWDEEVSARICTAVKAANPALLLYGLSGSETQKQALAHHVAFASEVFADRTYQNDGSLTPRAQPGAMITDEDKSLQQVLQMLQQKTVTTVSGKTIPIKADTLCIHGDGPHALAFAQRIHQALKQHGIEIKSL